VGGGAGFRVNRYVTLAADVTGIVAGVNGRPVGWSAGLQLGIPHTPHTFSLMATNVTSGTLQGTSTGVEGEVFWGFEFTVPFSGFARWGKILNPDGDTGTSDQVVSAPSPLADSVGTTVRWVNKDPVAHNTTGNRGEWDSPLIGPGETFEVTFTREGDFAYLCTPHPFMEATIRVVQP